jgi:hypothetical protein
VTFFCFAAKALMDCGSFLQEFINIIAIRANLISIFRRIGDVGVEAWDLKNARAIWNLK